MEIERLDFISMIRLATGIAGTVQGVIIKEFALLLAGFFLVYMAIADGHVYAGTDVLKLQQANTIVNENEHEKVDPRL